ncbi:hypothetical protein BU23DRAFT_559359 [Bimuria novae-zelandiae CBS 107.79]|uniref:DUF2293 domain-containing protein n=1 Tax=Bimuria novae-zelandiae CBS 107.79 TaxID=1447943 RepID=A0A6A5UUL5_9PLEO|nr:hypothetical protein BU23DRAFT_559359 [Bimuria novae-zelandiae CBS 107.79]
MAPKEVKVGPNAPMPKGYDFLKKGIKYKTLHSRRLTHEAGKTVYVVEQNKKVLGIRVPKDILSHVHAQANQTLSARTLATEKRDNAAIRQAAAEVDSQFPKIPEHDRELVLKHGFKKYSGRVGRTSMIPLPRKVLYAVIAHIRHRHTNYDKLLDSGVARDEARKRIQKKMQEKLREWGSTRGRRKSSASA